ncbi:MAG: hypothetical protein AMJ90_08590 [candidate division Zixibacteria bacterium SM23_73_2]|nr:MAG: hypothetical protein AMJ90_08590 [candidate division Zixibacteria bacterium SM23_73_2]
MVKHTTLKTFILLTILLLWSFPTFAQVDTAWVRRYNGPVNKDDYANSIAVDGSGNIYVTGYIDGGGVISFDYATIKYSPNGDTAWVRRYNAPGNWDDHAFDVAVDTGGNVYVTGSSYGTGIDPDFSDYATIKYHPNGDTAWVRRYNGPGNGRDRACRLAVDDSAYVYVTGRSWDNGTGDDYATIKYSPEGDTVWIRRYNGPGNGDDWVYGLAVDDSAYVYVTGRSEDSANFWGYATIKYYPNGDTAWIRRYNGPIEGMDFAEAIAVDSSGNVYVTGASYGTGIHPDYSDYATIKYYPNGDTAWVRRYNRPGNGLDYAKAIAVDSSGNVYVTGFSDSGGSKHDYATIKYYPDGDTAWARLYNGPGDSTDVASALQVDSSGNVYVTGGSYGSGTGEDYATIKYYPNGDTAWVKRYNGPGNGGDGARAMVIDGLGNVYVTGVSEGGETSLDYATIKYLQDEVFVEEENQDNIVNSFTLSQNYPNPFNPQTAIEYTLNSPCCVTLKIYNIRGQLIKALVDVNQNKGFHRITWDGKNEKGEETSSGIYFCRLKAGDYVITKKMVKLK